jgi:pheromone shutdown-related protein TraB
VSTPSDETAETAADSDVVRVDAGGRTYLLVGTAHISRESVELARRVIEEERPDCVCVELDERRYEALSHEKPFESLDLKEVIRRGQLSTLLVNLVLASYQKKLGHQLGVVPGTELLEAARVAERLGIPVRLCDRDVRVTLKRAWDSLSFWRRCLLLSTLLLAVFERQEISEEEVRRLKRQDVLSSLMQELGEEFPDLKAVLIDERDAYLAERIAAAPGEKIAAVVGAGHVAGIRAALERGRRIDVAPLETVPPRSPLVRLAGWSIPAVILSAIAFIGLRHGFAAAWDSALVWGAATGLPAMAGAFAALAHPVTALVALVAAPITTLTPLLGVGHVAALAQAYMQPPLVREFQSVPDDISSPGRWWRNRLLRIFLVFLLTSIGGSIGVFVGGAEILSSLGR